MSTRDPFTGPALFSYGFRPFFLSASLFGIIVIPLWWLVWRGAVVLRSPLGAVDWHVHEMVFGYGAAVVAGFLFTAVPNWTGRLPTRGWPLVLLVAIWIAGRCAMAGLMALGPMAVMLVDQLFLLAVVLMISREIVAGRNWRNLKVLFPVTLLWVANVGFHLESWAQGGADHGRRLGIALLVFLILLIGGRIIPSFTRNWLVQRGETRLPTPFGAFDGLCLVVAAVALACWGAAPADPLCAGLSLLAAALHMWRLLRWCGARSWRSPLLVMLHLSYLMAPLGFALLAGSALGVTGADSGAHVLGIGAIGGMTVAVMMRATMGHTGRPLVAGLALNLAFLGILVATLMRGLGYGFEVISLTGIDLSAILWTGSLAVLTWRIGPWLAAPRVAQKRPTGAPAR
ncbi:NnrS family protein [Epibacterium sp. MM17-32]|uniref:NnrS family protein n=1 Tax=Epibacterium sp. MM17-32 TaxID=2917734 RepID=UPI001EF665CE|nr:NnrS family protein [Epibacterium sp. MM17-32]MCG7626817.1 NnrS family protein [Epibacterium sp. MM17-32]